jgi:hypothetical protein
LDLADNILPVGDPYSFGRTPAPSTVTTSRRRAVEPANGTKSLKAKHTKLFSALSKEMALGQQFNQEAIQSCHPKKKIPVDTMI